VRNDPERLRFEITASDGAARTGRLHLAHGTVETPAFIPLATRGSVRSLDAAEVAGLGYELILGNTFHLMLSPGSERIAALGGLHRFMGWERPIITDSGGFQVFSLAHGRVADEIKGRRGRQPGQGTVLEIGEQGVRFRSYLDGSEQFLGPEESMAVQAALRSDIALAFDECTPYHADRDYTARSMERTHRWLDRCLAWHQGQGPRRQAVFGIVQGGVHEDLRRVAGERVSAAAVDGLAIGGTLGRDKEEMRGVIGMTAPHLDSELPRHLLGIGEPDDLVEGIALGVDLFDCAVPTRLARHGMALAPLPQARFRFDVRRAAFSADERPLVEGCPCPACGAHSRAYVHFLSRAEELTGVRLLVLHNLTYLERLVRGAREAIRGHRFGDYREAILGGASPWRAVAPVASEP
jgi:queuine tRNA-ribosyltransferase